MVLDTKARLQQMCSILSKQCLGYAGGTMRHLFIQFISEIKADLGMSCPLIEDIVGQ